MGTTTTSNMGLTLPNISQEPGPQFATDINNAFTTVDQHNHSSGNGVLINSNGLNLTQDLTLNSNNLTGARTVRLITLASGATSGTDLGCIYIKGASLYYNDTSGNPILIAASSATAIQINATSATFNTLSSSGFYFQKLIANDLIGVIRYSNFNSINLGNSDSIAWNSGDSTGLLLLGMTGNSLQYGNTQISTSGSVASGYFQSLTNSNPATSGVFRCSNGAGNGINFRNAANTGDLAIRSGANNSYLVLDGCGFDFNNNSIIGINSIAASSGFVGTGQNEGGGLSVPYIANGPQGYVGEYLSATSSGNNSWPVASVTHFSPFNITLSPGDWDVTMFAVIGASACQVTEIFGGISTSGPAQSNVLSGISGQDIVSTFNANQTNGISIPRYRITTSSSITAYFDLYANFNGAGVPYFQGSINARRVR